MKHTIVILGCNSINILNKRLNHSLNIINKNPKDSIIVAGGSLLKNNMKESYYMSQWLDERLSNVLVFSEKRSIDTVTNLIYVKRLIFSKNLSNNIIFVTSPTHKERVSCLSRYLFKHFEIKCYKDVSVIDSHDEKKAIERDKHRMALFLINHPQFKNTNI